MKVLAIAALAVVIGASSAYAQQQKRKAQPRAQQPAATTEVVCGGGWLNGRVVARDPDPNIRASMVREYSIFNASPGRAAPNSNTCVN